ncbi:MAG TPA: hypothetical protein VFU72_09270 [Nitrolancea sp.]|nr:hypothetical protein [Nitrolancea sp.]
MATSNRLFTLPFQASSNVTAVTLTGNPPAYSSGGLVQFTAVVFDTATGNPGDIKGATVNTAPILGVLQNSTYPAGNSTAGAIGPGDSADIMVYGVTKMVAGAAITYGALVSVDSSGRAVTAPAAGVSQVYAIGIAKGNATALGDLVEVILLPGVATQVNA